MWFKKVLSGIVACSMFVTLAGASYANPVVAEETGVDKSCIIEKETVTTHVTVHKISNTVDIEVVDKQTGKTLFEEEGATLSEILSQLEKPTEGNRQKRFVFVIPIAWGAAEVAAALVTTAVTTAGIAATVDTLSNSNHAKNSVFNSTKKEIEEAADDIPSKLKKDDDGYSVDMSKFNQKIRGKDAYKNKKTGWSIEATRGEGHKGDKWKLYNGDRRIASLTAEGKIVGK